MLGIIQTTSYLLLSSFGTALTDMISSVYNFLVLKFCAQGFLWGVLLCLKIGSWKEMNRVIFLWMLLFFSIVFGLNFFVAKLSMKRKNDNQEFKVWSKLWVLMKFWWEHVDECSCVGCAVSNFDHLLELCENTHRSHSIIILSLLLLFVSIPINFSSGLHFAWIQCDIYLKGLLFHYEVGFTLFFDMKFSFFLIVG